VIEGKPAIGIGSYAFRLEDQPFVDEFNKHLTEILTSGEAAKIGEPYGFTAADIPDGKVTTAQLCKK